MIGHQDSSMTSLGGSDSLGGSSVTTSPAKASSSLGGPSAAALLLGSGEDEVAGKHQQAEARRSAHSRARSGKARRSRKAVPLSEAEKLHRRREGNRRAAARLRVRRLETTKQLEERCAELQEECKGYHGQITALLDYCRTILGETALLKLQLQMAGALPKVPLGGSCNGQGADALLEQVQQALTMPFPGAPGGVTSHATIIAGAATAATFPPIPALPSLGSSVSTYGSFSLPAGCPMPGMLGADGGSGPEFGHLN